MKDISTRQDIELFVQSFYSKVKQDEVIGYIFNDVVKMDWPKHLPVMYDFWETVLLDANKYTANAMEKHFEVNKKIALEEKHFHRWLQLFNNTIDELFAGSIAALAKKRAKSVADIMLLKMNQINNSASIKNKSD